MKCPKDCTHIAKRIEERLTAIGILAEILVNNGGYKGDPGDVDNPAQINDRGESGIQTAIVLLAETAHSDFCQMATDLEIPQ